jgi:hypothetical protein
MSARVVTRPAKPKRRDSLLSDLLRSSSGQAFIVGLRMRGRLNEVDAVSPPGSLLDVVISELRSKTDLPPEIGLAVVHSLLSSALAQSGATVRWPGETHGSEMAMWHLVLAPSGAGKTLVRNLVTDALGLELRELPEPGSARAYLNAMAELSGKAAWTRDEYGQLMKAIADGGPLGGLRDYLLRTYDHARLEVVTAKSGDVAIEHPVLSIFGSTVDSTWASCIDAEMLADGLLARHLFVVAQRRPLSVPRYPLAEMRDVIQKAAEPLRDRLVATGQTYRISANAAKLYDELWMETIGQVGDVVDAAYFRRVTWSAARYAVIYHLLLDKPGVDVGVDAMRWAWRMVMLHLEYVRQVLSLSDAGFAAKIDKILGWVETRAAAGEDVTSNTFVRALCRQFSRDLSNASEARQLIDLARKSGKSA